MRAVQDTLAVYREVSQEIDPNERIFPMMSESSAGAERFKGDDLSRALLTYPSQNIH